MTNLKQPTLKINQLQTNPYQPRERIKKENLVSLINSIKSHGVIEPLIVAQTPAGYQIIAGERRWRAAKIAGLKEVPVVIKMTDRLGMLEMAIIENVQREDLNPIERAKAFKQLIDDFNMTAAKIAQQVGKSLTYVNNSLSLLLLPDAITDAITDDLITEGHAHAIRLIPDDNLRIQCYRQILKENASVKRAETLARRYRKHLNTKKKKRTIETVDVTKEDDKIKLWEKQIDAYFKSPTKLDISRSKGSTQVTFTFSGTPTNTQRDYKKLISLLAGKGQRTTKKNLELPYYEKKRVVESIEIKID